MFWARMKEREEINKAWREGFARGHQRGRQAALENLEDEISDGDFEASELSIQAVEVGSRVFIRESGPHRLDQVRGYESLGAQAWPPPMNPAGPATSYPSLFSMVDWVVSTPMGNKTVAFVPDANGRLKAILVDADPIGMPQE